MKNVPYLLNIVLLTSESTAGDRKSVVLWTPIIHRVVPYRISKTVLAP